MVAAAGVCAPGCGDNGAVGEAPATTLRIGLGAPEGSRGGTGVTAVVNLLTRDPWLTYRPDGRPGDRIATDWAWDEAGTTLRLKLRRDVFFHDGTQLTPEIAAEALRTTPLLDAPSFGGVTSFVPSGTDTVQMTLKERNAFILSDLASVMVVKPGTQHVATGPFKVETLDEDGAVVTAYPRYYRGRPALAGITVTKYPTQRNAWATLMRGDIDMLYEVSRDAVEFVEAETTVRAYSFPRPYYIPVVFNVRHPVLKNPEVRKAINEALDREALVREGMRGRGRPADGPIWPQHWAYSPPPNPFTYDPRGAMARLDRAGVRPTLRPDGKTSSRFSFTCLVFADDARFERLAALTQKQLADVGVDMVLQPVRARDLVDRIAKGDFDAFLFEMAGRSLNWVYEFWRHHEGGMNNSGYRAADAVLDRIRVSLDDGDVRAGVTELQRVMRDDPPAAFLAWQETARAVSSRFDVAAEEKRDVILNVWQWRSTRAANQAAR